MSCQREQATKHPSTKHPQHVEVVSPGDETPDGTKTANSRNRLGFHAFRTVPAMSRRTEKKQQTVAIEKRKRTVVFAYGMRTYLSSHISSLRSRRVS